VIVREVDGRGGELSQIAHALNRARRLSRLVQRRQQNPDQHRDNADDNQQFDQRERGAFAPAHCGPFDPSERPPADG
jgi:hypothetical protein